MTAAVNMPQVRETDMTALGKCRHCGQPFNGWDLLATTPLEEQRTATHVDAYFPCPVCRTETPIRLAAGPSIPVSGIARPATDDEMMDRIERRPVPTCAHPRAVSDGTSAWCRDCGKSWGYGEPHE